MVINMIYITSWQRACGTGPVLQGWLNLSIVTSTIGKVFVAMHFVQCLRVSHQFHSNKVTSEAPSRLRLPAILSWAGFCSTASSQQMCSEQKQLTRSSWTRPPNGLIHQSSQQSHDCWDENKFIIDIPTNKVLFSIQHMIEPTAVHLRRVSVSNITQHSPVILPVTANSVNDSVCNLNELL